MKHSKFSRRAILKSLIVTLILFSMVSIVVSQSFDRTPETILNKNNTSNKKEIYEEYEEFEVFSNLLIMNTYFSVTTSYLPDENSVILGIPLLSLYIFSNVIIAIRKQLKLSKSEVRNKNLDREIEVNLTSQESLILDFVREFLSKNRFLEVDKVIPYINARLLKSETSLNKNGIKNVLDDLLKKKVIVNGSKLTRNDILDNSNRLSIYNLVLNNPGIHFMYIVNLLGMSIFLVKWHLSMLLKFNLINTTRVENREIYYNSHLTEKTAKRLHFMSRERTLKIINYLKSKPKGCSKYRISKELKIHPTTTTKYIHKLEEFEVISGIQHPNKTLYILNRKSFFK